MQRIIVKGKDGKKKMVTVPGWNTGYFIDANSTYNDLARGLLPSLYLDSGRIDSYNGNTTWYDISGNTKNATLFNGATTITSSYGPIMNFVSASSQFASGSNLGTLTTFTAIVWTKLDAPLSAGTNAFVTDKYTGTDLNYAIGSLNSTSTSVCGGYYKNGIGWITSSLYAPSVNTWYCFATTYDGTNLKLYVNGKLYSTVASATTPGSSGAGYNVAKRWDSSVAGDFIDGQIPVVLVYNKALTASQIFDIYSQFKIRYII